MARKDRTGSRKPRSQQTAKRVPKMGYYLVVTDTEATERCYFTGLHDSLPEEVKEKLVIKVVETKTQNLIQKCLEMTAYEAQYRIPWIVFDRDQVQNFDQIVRDAEKAGIKVGWSNPCFEIWMYAYFDSMPAIQESWVCCSKFAELYKTRTGRVYSKSDAELYGRLCESGNEDKALKLAKEKYEQCIKGGKQLPSEMFPATTVYELVREIKRKAVTKGNI
ncbi:MAG: RloB family protein [Oscillospiraceae bacterium]|nr:RloB family protein [Oscillospiraceae bacterium]